MAEGTSTQGFHRFDMPEDCSLCQYPLWATPEGPIGSSSMVRINDCVAVSASADQGCDGCKLISQVWQVFIPDAIKRQHTTIDFDSSEEHLWIELHERHATTTRGVDVFTLLGMCAHVTNLA
jgi:hypothetical protein